MPFADYLGNASIAASLRQMLAEDRLPQTLLFAGPRGVGKATLARFLAAASNCRAGDGDFCGRCTPCERILAADLSRGEYQEQFAEREKLPAAKRNESPLIVSTHPDFLIFPPDGPLRMISIEQARQLRHAAQFGPSEGRRRFFVIDEADRANDEAANSLLKTLEEPAPSLTIVLTAESPYELLPTIRSRSVPFYFSPLDADAMRRFLASRSEFARADQDRLTGWSQGSPGRALALDADEYLARREAMLAMLRTALGEADFGELAGRTEALARKTKEKIDVLAEMLYGLLGDLLRLRHGAGGIVHADIRPELTELSRKADFEWIEQAADALRELERLSRRNIQKQIALEAYAVRLRGASSLR